MSLKEQIIKFILFFCSLTSGLALLLIIIFLFVETGGILGADPLEGEYELVIHKSNPLEEISSRNVKDIFDEKITNWKSVGGLDAPIEKVTVDNIDDYLGDADVDDLDLDDLPSVFSEILVHHPNAVLYIPIDYQPQGANAKILKVEPITLWGMLKGDEWYPTTVPAPLFGLLPLLIGTFMVTFGALVFAFPLAMATSIYLADLAKKKERKILKFFIELLNSIPSVVYGFFGLVVLVPWVQECFNIDVGETALTGSLILAIMILPTVVTIAEDALRATPKGLKEASYALGSNRWQMISKVMLPFATPGIKTAFILGMGRAFGETMAVLMVTGNSSGVPHSFLEPVRTIPATIAAELGEAPTGGLHYNSLFLLGVILFIFTVLTNAFITLNIRKRKNKRFKFSKKTA